MSTPKKKAPRPDDPAQWKQPPPRKDITVFCNTGEDSRPRFAESIASPEVAAMRVIRAAEGEGLLGGKIDTPCLLDRLRTQSSAVNSGDMQQVEAMLMNQATALQSLFAKLIERGMSCTVVQQLDMNLRLALRAQSQCCRTLEALAEIKNPPVVFAKTANIAHQQQVNNGVITAESRPPTADSPQNKLAEARHELCQDSRSPAIDGRVGSSLETVGAVNRPEVARG
ncbi:MAG: hypothetical protein LAE24_00160 [Candidatus Contendobacter sp.]|nr:hypothetical protein [Candidatus Contendobacter sp.]